MENHDIYQGDYCYVAKKLIDAGKGCMIDF